MTRNLQIPSEAISELQIPQIIDITDQLPFNPKYTWKSLCGERTLEDLTTIVLHHDAWPKKNRAGVDDITFAREIAQDHIDSKSNEKYGDPGFPYHFWIRNGQAYQTNDILDFLYGVANHNPYTVHICVSGDYYTYDTLTDPDRKALYGVLLAVKAVLPSYNGIAGHCELAAKNCPGYDHVRVRKDVSALDMKIAMRKERSRRIERAYLAAKRTKELFDKASDPNFEWTDTALDKLSDIADFMQEKDYLYP